MRLRLIDSLGELRRAATAWDELWWRSDSAMPTHRAELLAQWLEHFAAGRRFAALTVEDGGQLVAALPLVERRWAGIVNAGQLASNCWSESGALLFDRQADGPAAMGRMIEGLRRLRWPILLLDGVPLESPPWSTLTGALQEHRLQAAMRPQFHVGLIDITRDWDAYVAALSRNHRGAIKNTLRRLQKQGDVQLLQLRDATSDQIGPYLHRAFEIEDRSWKGREGTSVLRRPGMFDFFWRQAQQLAEWGQLELLFLKLDDAAIAFEYCYTAKGVTASHKIGYDETFRRYGPGRLLRYLQLQRYFADPQRHLLDTMGVLCESKAKWCTRSQPASRLICSTGGTLGRQLVATYENLWPRLRTVLRREEALNGQPPKLGAAQLRPAADAVPC